MVSVGLPVISPTLNFIEFLKLYRYDFITAIQDYHMTVY